MLTILTPLQTTEHTFPLQIHSSEWGSLSVLDWNCFPQGHQPPCANSNDILFAQASIWHHGRVAFRNTCGFLQFQIILWESSSFLSAFPPTFTVKDSLQRWIWPLKSNYLVLILITFWLSDFEPVESLYVLSCFYLQNHNNGFYLIWLPYGLNKLIYTKWLELCLTICAR